jgi:hypothetical protein
MIVQRRLISSSSRSLAAMIGFAQPAGSRGTWRSDGDIDRDHRRSRRLSSFVFRFPFLPAPGSSSGWPMAFVRDLCGAANCLTFEG